MTDALISDLDLTAYAGTLIKNCSGGTKRRVATAAAMLGDPDLLLLDEPTTGMDPRTRRLVWRAILQATHERHQAVVLTSHK